MMNWKALRPLLFISGALTLLICAVMNLWLIPAIENSTQGLRCFDMNLFYTPQQARQFLSLLSEEGKSLYLTRQLPLDFFYPVAYTAFFVLAIRFAARRHTKLIYLPFLLAVSDYGENICVLRMLKSDTFPDALAVTGSVFTATKTVLMYVCIITILMLLVRYGLTRRKERKSKTE